MSDASPEVDTPRVSSQTLDTYQHLLLGGEPTLSAEDVARELHVEVELIERYWLEMGFQLGDRAEKQFTEWDVHALRYWGASLKEAGISDETAAALTRAQSHLADRLVLWEMEALVQDAERTHHLDDTSSRVVAIHEMKDVIDAFESHMTYAWRRHMYALIERMTRDIAVRAKDPSRRRFPLSRALGFVDMVSYTSTSSILGGKLVGLIERFEYLCRSVVTANGGRVVKMMGDAVFFIADNLEVGLNVVTSLIQTLGETEDLLPVRASLIQGDVFSRSGDVFGPPVNLAARLVDVAPTGQILTDAPTAAAIASSSLRKEYRVEDLPPVHLRGFGKVTPFVVTHIVTGSDTGHERTRDVAQTTLAPESLSTK